MQVSAVPYIGQLVPLPQQKSILSLDHAKEIKNTLVMQGGIKERRIEVLVTSGNQLKIDAARNSVVKWIQELFNETMKDIHVQGYAVRSDIDEQPHSQDDTFTGAKNRLKNLKTELLMGGVNSHVLDGTLRILVSLENGIMPETVKIDPRADPKKFKDIFQTETGAVWVDRCITAVEIWFGGQTWDFTAISEGVTTPRAEVDESKKTNWRETAGKFLEKTYGWKANNFHADLAGKGRELLMKELLIAGFGLPYNEKV